MARKLSRFAQLQAITASVLVHASLIGLLVISFGWKGFWLPQPVAKSGELTPLEGFTVVLAPSDATMYTPSSESLIAKEQQQAEQSAEAEQTRLMPEQTLESSAQVESGIGAEQQQKELPENAQSARVDSDERIAGGSPDANKADGERNELLSRYYKALRQNIALRWQGPIVAEKAECRLLLSQLEQGQLVDVVFLDCPIDAEVRQQIIRALDKTIALPYSGFEPVIENQMEVLVCFPSLVSC